MGKMMFNHDLEPTKRLIAGVIGIFSMFVVILASLWWLTFMLKYIDAFWIAFFFYLLFVAERYAKLWNKYSPFSPNKVNKNDRN